MKKIISLFLIFWALSSIVFAGNQCYCSDSKELTCGFTRVVTNCLGMKFLAEKTAEKIIAHSLRKNFNGSFDVDIESFSAPDLKKGRIKSATIHGKNLAARGVYISEVKVNTLCDYNYVEYNKDPIIFHTNIPLKFETTITEEDLNNTVVDMKLIDDFSHMNGYGISLFKVEDVKIKLKNNKIYLIVCVKAPILMGDRLIKISFTGKLNIVDGKIVFENITSENLRNVSLDNFLAKLNEINMFTQQAARRRRDCGSLRRMLFRPGSSGRRTVPPRTARGSRARRRKRARHPPRMA